MAILRNQFRLSSRAPAAREVSHLWRARAAFLAAFLWMCACAPIGSAQSGATAEYQLKAAFLFNFAKFIDWPPASFAGPQANFSICILGADPFGRSMDELLRGKTLVDRHVTVERSKQVADVRHCQMVFVSSSEKWHVREILDGLKGTNALAVGETEGFAAAGGAIQFAIEDNHVHFLINPDAADRARLRVSSNLLSLAHIVHDSEKNDRS